MSNPPAPPTRRHAAVRCTIAVLGAACVPLLVVGLAAPSPALVAVLAACAVATGAFVARSVPRALLVRRSHRPTRGRRRRPIRPTARRVLAEFRRELDALPETKHPIGL